MATGKISIKNNTLIVAVRSLEQLANKQFPALVAYNLARLAQKLQEANVPINATRDKLIKEFGEEKDGNFSLSPTTETGVGEEKKSIPNPKFTEFTTAFGAVLDEETEMECIKVLIPANSCELEPAVLLGLIDFIEVVVPVTEDKKAEEKAE